MAQHVPVLLKGNLILFVGMDNFFVIFSRFDITINLVIIWPISLRSGSKWRILILLINQQPVCLCFQLFSHHTEPDGKQQRDQ